MQRKDIENNGEMTKLLLYKRYIIYFNYQIYIRL